MNPTVRAILEKAQDSLKVETPVTATKLGDRQIEQRNLGGLVEMAIEKNRELKAKKSDGNISPEEFERLW